MRGNNPIETGRINLKLLFLLLLTPSKK